MTDCIGPRCGLDGTAQPSGPVGPRGGDQRSRGERKPDLTMDQLILHPAGFLTRCVDDVCTPPLLRAPRVAGVSGCRQGLPIAVRWSTRPASGRERHSPWRDSIARDGRDRESSGGGPRECAGCWRSGVARVDRSATRAGPACRSVGPPGGKGWPRAPCALSRAGNRLAPPASQMGSPRSDVAATRGATWTTRTALMAERSSMPSLRDRRPLEDAGISSPTSS
jgi:hypothetical protein